VTVEEEVAYVSVDVLTYERDGLEDFGARVRVGMATLKGLDHVPPTAGMPAEVAIRAGGRRLPPFDPPSQLERGGSTLPVNSALAFGESISPQ
jgi:hypothetical protein